MGLYSLAVAAVRAHSMLGPGDRIVVGVSGGPDSLALLYCLLEMSQTMDLDLGISIAHLNHMLRGEESDGDEDFVISLAETLGISVMSQRLDVKARARETGRSTEELGREARYELFRMAASKAGASKIAVAHHRDDQVETVILRLLRGAGPRGLSGIPPVRQDGCYTVIRPFICATKSDIEIYCRDKGLRPRRDASNYESTYERNKIRNQLLPLLESEYNSNIREALARTASICSSDNDYLTGLAQARLESIGIQDGLGRICLPLDELRAAPLPILQRLIILAFTRTASKSRDLYHSHISSVCDLVRSGRVGARISLPSDVTAAVTYDTLILSAAGYHHEQADMRAIKQVRLAVPGTTYVVESGQAIHAFTGPLDQACSLSKETLAAQAQGIVSAAGRPDLHLSPADMGKSWVVFDIAATGHDIEARSWKQGDRMRPFGMKGRKKIADILIDLKVPKARRMLLPVVVSGDRVLWVAGVIQSEEARVVPDTRALLVLVAQELDEVV